MADDRKDLTVSEAGRLGGEKVKEKYGREFYSAIGKKGGNATSKKYGVNYLRDIASKGGETTQRNKQEEQNGE